MDRDGAIGQGQEMWMLCDKAAGIYGRQTGWLIGKWIAGREGCNEGMGSVRRRRCTKKEGTLASGRGRDQKGRGEVEEMDRNS